MSRLRFCALLTSCFLFFGTSNTFGGTVKTEYNTNNIIQIAVGGYKGKIFYAGIYFQLEKGWDLYADEKKFALYTVNPEIDGTIEVFKPKSINKTYDLGFGDISEKVYLGKIFIPFIIKDYKTVETNAILEFKTCNSKACVPHKKVFKLSTIYQNPEWLEYIQNEIAKNDSTTVKKGVGKFVSSTLRFIPSLIQKID